MGEAVRLIAMKTYVFIRFEGEPASRHAAKRQMIYDDPVMRPEVGDTVHNPTAGTDGEPLHGILLRRQFAYSATDVSVHLVLRDPNLEARVEPRMDAKRRSIFDFTRNSRE